MGTDSSNGHMEMAKPQMEHEWLEKLVGDWVAEVEPVMGPDKPPETFAGTESVRSLGGLCFLLEGKGAMPGGDEGLTIMTLGYDPQKSRFVGTFVASMMTWLWVYEGELDPSKRRLTLRTEGPDMSGEGKTASYRDEIEFLDDDHRTLTSYMQGSDGQWQQIMVARYERKR